MTRMRTTLCLVFVLFVFLQACSRGNQCDFCDRPIHQGMKATAVIKGKKYKACCISCAVTARAQDASGVMDSVTDFETNAAIDPQSAVYVEGSNLHPCATKEKAIRDEHSAAFERFDRCEPSIIAFENRNDALKFQSQEGGKVLTLAEVQGLRHQH